MSKQPLNLSSITTYQSGVAQATANRMLQKRCDEALHVFGITKMQWLVIGTVLDAGKSGTRVSELAKKVDTTLSYLTNTINLLESKGMLQRHTQVDDVRSKIISINPTFIPLCSEIETTLRKALRSTLYDHINPDDLRTYIKVIYQIAGVEKHGKV